MRLSREPAGKWLGMAQSVSSRIHGQGYVSTSKAKSPSRPPCRFPVPLKTYGTEKSARKSDPDGVKIEAHETADGVQICARYPRPDGELNDCEGSQQTRNNDVVVDFTLKVPAGVHLVAHTVNGAIEVDHLSGDISVNTVNGSIDISTSGEAEAQTVNGSIHARVGRDHWTGGSFETVNGAVVVTLPEDVDAEVRASTVNGHVSSDFELSIPASGRIIPLRIHATIGSGGPMLSLSTVNGEIALRSSGGSKPRR